MATPNGSSTAPSVVVSPAGSGWSRWVGHAITSCIPPSTIPWPAKATAGHKLRSPRAQDGHRPQGMAGSTATGVPAMGPSRTTPAISWPGTTGRVSRASPIPPSANQCRSEPQMPTSVTRTKV